MAERRDRPFQRIELPHELQSLLALAQQIGVHEAARQQQRPVLLRPRPRHGVIDRQLLSRNRKFIPLIRPGRSETMRTSAPSRRNARIGMVTSTCSNPSTASTATRSPWSRFFAHGPNVTVAAQPTIGGQ